MSTPQWAQIGFNWPKLFYVQSCMKHFQIIFWEDKKVISKFFGLHLRKNLKIMQYFKSKPYWPLYNVRIIVIRFKDTCSNLLYIQSALQYMNS